MDSVKVPLVGPKLTKKQAAMIRRAKKFLRATGDPTNVIVAKHLTGGLQIVNFLFEATRRAQKGVPKGFEVEPVTVTATTLKAKGQCVAAQWLIVAMQEALARGENIVVSQSANKSAR